MLAIVGKRVCRGQLVVCVVLTQDESICSLTLVCDERRQYAFYECAIHFQIMMDLNYLLFFVALSILLCVFHGPSAIPLTLLPYI